MAELFPVHDIAGARELLAQLKKRFSDTSHVVHAYVIGPSGGILGCSDDGEPAGTAGRPALEVLQHSGITDVMVAITRWWGGIKLGTGGLVRAYSTSTQGVLATAVSREIIAMAELEFTLPYPLIESGKRILSDAGFAVNTEDYDAAGDHITGTLPEADAPALRQRLTDLSRGQIVFS